MKRYFFVRLGGIIWWENLMKFKQYTWLVTEACYWDMLVTRTSSKEELGCFLPFYFQKKSSLRVCSLILERAEGGWGAGERGKRVRDRTSYQTPPVCVLTGNRTCNLSSVQDAAPANWAAQPGHVRLFFKILHTAFWKQNSCFTLFSTLIGILSIF